MDSYNFHFERMSNIDLHTLSLPVSRLSPAKSNSSIVDQLAHHQHGKGDSAYSSFSGGSTAPDYPSPFLPDDLHSSSFSHYADLKNVKSIHHPSQVLQSDSKTMDQLYHSVEVISKQYHNNSSTSVNQHNSNDSFHNNNKALSNQEVLLGASTQNSHSTVQPPPVPARMDSFITTKNLENTRVQHNSSEVKPQQVQLQQQSRSYSRLHTQQHCLNPQSHEKANSDTGNSSFNSDPVPVWKGPQLQQPQGQQPPVFHPHQSHDQTRVPPEYLFIMDKAASEQHKSKNILSGSPPRGVSQSGHIKPRQFSTSSGCKGDLYKSSDSNSNFESQRKRSHSAYDCFGSELTHAVSPWNASHSFTHSSIQHKGQFYFVTGLSKLSDSGMRTDCASVCGSNAGSESSTMVEKYQIREKERSHSTMDNLFRPLHESSSTSSDTLPDERETFSVSQGKDMSSVSQDQENYRPSFISTHSSQSFDTLEEINMIENREIGRHTANNPIFYCGPDRNSLSHSTMQTKEVTSLISNKVPSYYKREEQGKRGKRQPLGDVVSERINKETTPLLYHLTEANRTALQPKKDSDISIKGKEAILNKLDHGDVIVNDNERPLHDDRRKNNRGDVMSVACNTLDDSFKKYYKEKLKDAQSKVLRETSFKRRDLQLSWPHRIRQKPELRPTVIHSFSPSVDFETSTSTLTPSLISEEMEQQSIKEDNTQNQKETNSVTEKENGKPANMAQPANVAQPQVARIGGRKRLTPEQKKMCFSEPEKLNLLGGTPNHSACHSFGNESENQFVAECEREEPEQQGEQGLVATRRKLFETRGRALSASSTSKTDLKHLQHKALVEYMERKTSQKVAEPQTPAPQVPPPSRQRHSLGEKPFDWGHRPLSGNTEGKNIKKKLHRPHSAGRILDSSNSSIRYAQFFSVQSCSGQYAGQSNQPRRRESQGPCQGKSVSAESLLDQPDPPNFYRNRSKSTPHAFQAHKYTNEPLPIKAMETCSPQKNTTEDSLVKPVLDGQQRVRVVAQRGKSMEELGTLKLTKPSPLSKSSEQLDQLCRLSPGGLDIDKKNSSFITEVRQAQGLEREWKKQYPTEQVGKEPGIAGQKSTQGQIQNQTQKSPPLKQNLEPGIEVTVSTRNLSYSTSPASCSTSQTRVHSGSPGCHDPVIDEFRSSRLPSETPSSRGLDTSEEIKSTPTTPVQTEPPCEIRPCFSRVRTSSVTRSQRELSVDESSDDSPPPISNDEVSLSCGITTDPSLWILPPEEEIKEVQNDSIFEDESIGSAPQTQTTETSVSSCTSPSDADVSQQIEEESNTETDEEKSQENQNLEERGAPEGETESMEEPREKSQWVELVEAVVSADQSLARVLYPLTNRKTALMLMEQLLSEDTLLMEEHYKKKQEQRGAAGSPEGVKGAESAHCLSASDSHKRQYADLQSRIDIAEKKQLLVSCIQERLHSVEKMRAVLQADIQENTARGEALELLVREHCQSVELERYNLFIGDLERVVSLLLCLSARLARVQNALSTVDQHTDAEEKHSLDSRHRLLCKQREDAKDLKDNLDRRENLVSTFLSRKLSSEQLQDYRRFVQTKASLLIQQKDLEEKQRLGEEQLEALSNSFNL